MAQYRLYLLKQDGHISGYEVFEADDDETAISEAENLDGADKELWCAARRIKQWRLHPKDHRPVS